MAKKKSKELSLSKVKTKSKEFDKTESCEIEDGDYVGEAITFFPKFSDLKIEELLEELKFIQNEIFQNKLNISDKNNVQLIQMLIIKHFTHFQKQIPSNIELIDWMVHFKKTGLFDFILEKVFLPDQVAKVYDRLTSFVSNGLLANNFEKDVDKKFSKLKLEHKSLFEQIDNMKIED